MCLFCNFSFQIRKKKNNSLITCNSTPIFRWIIFCTENTFLCRTGNSLLNFITFLQFLLRLLRFQERDAVSSLLSSPGCWTDEGEGGRERGEIVESVRHHSTASLSPLQLAGIRGSSEPPKLLVESPHPPVITHTAMNPLGNDNRTKWDLFCFLWFS